MRKVAGISPTELYCLHVLTHLLGRSWTNSAFGDLIVVIGLTPSDQTLQYIEVDMILRQEIRHWLTSTLKASFAHQLECLFALDRHANFWLNEHHNSTITQTI